MTHKEIMVFFLEPEIGDILFMLEDYIQKSEDNLSIFGDPEDDIDKEVQEIMQANLAVALRLEEKLTKSFELSKETGQ
tara:strand:+ start:2141 stop:2374 length:234 start_codon:yes stop_codon:yes gene_type:complete